MASREAEDAGLEVAQRGRSGRPQILEVGAAATNGRLAVRGSRRVSELVAWVALCAMLRGKLFAGQGILRVWWPRFPVAGRESWKSFTGGRRHWIIIVFWHRLEVGAVVSCQRILEAGAEYRLLAERREFRAADRGLGLYLAHRS